MASGKTTQGDLTKGKVASFTPILKDGEHQKDQKGNFKFIVKFEGVDTGYTVSTRDSGGSGWRVGEDVEYIPGTWTSDDGTYTMHFASLPKKQFPQKSYAQPKGVKQYKAEAVVAAISATATLIAMKDGVTESDYPNYFKAIYRSAEAEINKIFSEQ